MRSARRCVRANVRGATRVPLTRGRSGRRVNTEGGDPMAEMDATTPEGAPSCGGRCEGCAPPMAVVAPPPRAGNVGPHAVPCPLLEGGSDDWIRCCTTRFLPLALQSMGDDATARDVLQDSWIAVLQGINRYQGTPPACAWVRTIVWHTSGKFITIYPRDEDHFVKLVARFHEATKEFKGPRVLSDRRYPRSSVLHYRYGTFRPGKATHAPESRWSARGRRRIVCGRIGLREDETWLTICVVQCGRCGGNAAIRPRWF